MVVSKAKTIQDSQAATHMQKWMVAEEPKRQQEKQQQQPKKL
jgi:hypothetical protein